MNNVRIVITGPGTGKLFVNGKEVEGLVGFNLRVQAKEINYLTLVMPVGEVEVDAQDVLLIEEKQ